jgi:hypothetical protein
MRQPLTAQAPWDGHILEMLPLPLIQRATISSPTLWQSVRLSWINSSDRPGLEEGVGQVKREGNSHSAGL